MNRSVPETSARPLESRLFRAFWDDGLLDLLFGIGALAFGVSWSVGLLPLGAVVPALLALLWNPLRRWLVEPRAGWVEFGGARTTSNRRKLAGALGLGGALLILFIGLALAIHRAGAPDLLRHLDAALPALLIGILAVLFGAGLRILRFFLYALLFAGAGFGSALAKQEPEIAILAGGAAVTLCGLFILTRFRRVAGRPGERE